MIRLIEALNYRSFRYIKQPVGDYQILIGANSSGKSTFSDIIAFLGRLMSDGLDAAIDERVQDFDDLTWRHQGDRFELAIEVAIPIEFQTPIDNPVYDTIRYEISIGADDVTNSIRILDEQISLIEEGESLISDPNSDLYKPPGSLFGQQDFRRRKDLITSREHGEPHLYPERPIDEEEKLSSDDFLYPGRTNPRTTILSTLISMHNEFPAASWLADRLICGIVHIKLNSLKLHDPTAREGGFLLMEDGSSLPSVVLELKHSAPAKYDDWILFLQTIMPELDDIKLKKRREDGSHYVMLRYTDGLEIPQWMISDGILRILVLTIITYVPEIQSIYVIEEPESNLNPLNVEMMLQSLRSFRDGQMFLVTHSPIIIRMSNLNDVLVFSRDDQNGAKITIGSQHPSLEDWDEKSGLATLFARGDLV